MYDISNAKRIVNTSVISKLVRMRKGSIYRERMKEGYEKKKDHVPFTICSVRLFGGSRASATSTLVPRVHGTQEDHGKDLWPGRSTKEAERHTMVACLAPRLTRTVYCSSPEALGTSLARIAARGFPRLGKIRRGRG